MTVHLLTSQDTYEKLHEIADTRKQEVKINTETLSHLLIDHSVMEAALRSRRIKINGPSLLRRIKINGPSLRKRTTLGG